MSVVYKLYWLVPTANEMPNIASNSSDARSIDDCYSVRATVSAILLASAAVNHWLGSAGLAVATGIAGFADTHSAGISVASLAAAQNVTAPEAVLPILVGLTTNTITKAVVAATTGGRGFAFQIIPGLLLVILAAWLGLMME